MIAGCEHGRVVKVLAYVTAEGLFDGHQACEGSAQPVGRVGDVEGFIAKDVHDNVGYTEGYTDTWLVVMAAFVLPGSIVEEAEDGRRDVCKSDEAGRDFLERGEFHYTVFTQTGRGSGRIPKSDPGMQHSGYFAWGLLFHLMLLFKINHGCLKYLHRHYPTFTSLCGHPPTNL